LVDRSQSINVRVEGCSKRARAFEQRFGLHSSVGRRKSPEIEHAANGGADDQAKLARIKYLGTQKPFRPLRVMQFGGEAEQKLAYAR